jgi:hypothetical protein
VDFGVPINVLSFGCGYWGCGAPVVNPAGTGFFGNGEVHGVIELVGDYTSITFTDTSENWHGITVGVLGVSTPGTQVPEPVSLALLGSALGALALPAASAEQKTATHSKKQPAGCFFAFGLFKRSPDPLNRPRLMSSAIGSHFRADGFHHWAADPTQQCAAEHAV